jgi:hypothetical protein
VRLVERNRGGVSNRRLLDARQRSGALKIAVFAPMPTAMIATVTIVKPGDLRSSRPAWTTSCRSRSHQSQRRDS